MRNLWLSAYTSSTLLAKTRTLSSQWRRSSVSSVAPFLIAPSCISRLRRAARSASLTLLDRELALHTFLRVTVHRAVKLVGASLELYFQFGAMAGPYFFGFRSEERRVGKE